MMYVHEHKRFCEELHESSLIVVAITVGRGGLITAAETQVVKYELCKSYSLAIF